MTKLIPVPKEYRATVQPNGMVDWQCRLDEYIGGDVYKRPFLNLWEIERYLIDRYGAQFADKVVKTLKRLGRIEAAIDDTSYSAIRGEHYV